VIHKVQLILISPPPFFPLNGVIFHVLSPFSLIKSIKCITEILFLMYVSEILQETDETRFSLEVYPPKTPGSKKVRSLQKHLSAIFDTVEHLRTFDPIFISVTYNPEGKTRATSIPIAAIIKQKFRIESVAHLTCIVMPRDELKRTLDVLDYFRIENILALRGDKPKDYVPLENPMDYASDLVAEIKRHDSHFCIGVAAYPEGHMECVNGSGERELERDLANFELKVKQGALFSISQLFLENAMYFDFLERSRKSGIEIPIIPGIMPLTDYKSLRVFHDLCGASIPPSLRQKIEDNKDDPEEIREIGVEHAIGQCKGLMDRVPCIHFYTMDKWEPTERIITELQ